MKKYRKNGFTLVELVVVLAIVGILAVAGIFSAGHFIKLAEFRKNEENAKTAFLAAESTLTWYRSSGEWDAFREKVMTEGTRNDTFDADDEKSGRIYAVTINDTGRGAVQSASDGLARRLLEGGAYSGDFFDAAIAIEVDVETGKVYAAFYGTRCHTLAYDGTNTNGVLNISAQDTARTYEERREHLLGYYAADLVNVVALKPVRLKVTTISLINSETLSLNWTSNSRHDNLDVKFAISFYDKNTNKELFSTEVGQAQREALKTGSQTVNLNLTVPGDAGAQEIGTWVFPLNYQGGADGSGGRYSLALDGMMTAELMEVIESRSGLNGIDAGQILQQYSTSITRLGDKVAALKAPRDIYAKITVEPDYTYAAEGTFTEYRASGEAVSNIENTLYASAAENGAKLDAKISKFRHLSNIRYYDQRKAAEFTLADENMDWTAAGTGMYGLAVDDGTGALRSLTWQAVAQESGQALDFPSVEMLPAGHTFKGEGASASISNLKLGADSVPKDAQVDTLYTTDEEQKNHRTQYIGLFCETEGTVQDITFSNPSLVLVGGDALGATQEFENIYGAGVLSGRSQGVLKNISVRTTEKDRQIVTVNIKNRAASNTEPAAIGGLVGLVAGKDETTGELVRLNSFFKEGAWAINKPELSGLTVEGAVTGVLPDVNGNKDWEFAASTYWRGVGGIFGHVQIGRGTDAVGLTNDKIQIVACRNHAGVTGNMLTGGIVGSVRDAAGTATEWTGLGEENASIRDCGNDGLVLCSSSPENPDNTLEGRYFGGITGYGYSTYIYKSVSASGRAGGYSYSAGQKDTVLKGRYVGGIIGYGGNSSLAGCSTEKDGYVLGNDYVGGIAGGMEKDAATAIQGAADAIVTTNGSNVIGNDYVGGILGENGGAGSSETSVTNCVNNGIVAGYGKFIGGIVGYNGQRGAILNCASNLPDHNGSLLKTIVEDWEAKGDCVGGLAGYNNGRIEFKSDNNLAEKSLSGIVAGKNYVGGLVGFNDVSAILDVHYTLISGQVYASGDGVGGLIGLNASENVLRQTIKVRPSGVRGRYYVGGIIGANVVNLRENVTVKGLQADNRLGSITGDAFTGGVIGYQRTYTADQLNISGSSSLWKYMESSTAKRLLPGLDDKNVPKKAVASQNLCILTIKEIPNGSSLQINTDNNNIPISCNLYTGGIVGYCERDSRLALVNCVNSGALSRRSTGQTGEAGLVSLKAYLASGEVDADTEALKGDIRVSIGGGIIGANLDHQVVDKCENKGAMRGFIGLGGIVGFNAGGVFNCKLSDNFGNTALDYIGGIVGLNVQSDSGKSEENKEQLKYTDVENTKWAYTSGTIASCVTSSGISIAGRSFVGGIAGYNMSGAYLEKNSSKANITAAGNYVGGIAGANSGTILQEAVSPDDPADGIGMTATNIAGNRGEGIGGLVGWNQAGGSIMAESDGTEAEAEVVVVNAGVTVTGNEKVGGIVGIHGGSLGSGGTYLVCEAELVQAVEDCAGGIIGAAETEAGTQGNADRMISYAINRSEEVTADRGRAGGIVAVNNDGFTVSACINQGNVNSDQGYAGGIAAENYGSINDCTVEPDGADMRISSQGADAIGAVCAVNCGNVSGSRAVKPESSGTSAMAWEVRLEGDAGIVGGIAGKNVGGRIVGSSMGDDSTVSVNYMPYVGSFAGNLTVGVVAGLNESGSGHPGKISHMTVSDITMSGFGNYRYMGGIVGENSDVLGAIVEACTVRNTTIEQASGSEAGNCYGGIAGNNRGELNGCIIRDIAVDVQGVYTATSTSTTAEKERLSSHVGGIAGKNEESGYITGCLIESAGNGKVNTISTKNGMAGGVTGYNKGRIELSGDAVTAALMKTETAGTGGKEKVRTVQALIREAVKQGVKKDAQYVSWQNGTVPLNSQRYDHSEGQVSEQNSDGTSRTLKLLMETNGNLGGITAYNVGSVDYCASGNWYLNNQSEAIGVGTGGIIGMNESDENLSFLLNQAFVGRELRNGDTNRFAGGIIGNQNNSVSGGWVIENCVNYGTVYCKKTHYSGGIIGQWTGRGGSIEKCYNFGNLQTTYGTGWVGASGGIVAQLYHAYTDNEYNIVSCENHGNIYGQDGRNYRAGETTTSICANDSAGILGNVTTYKTGADAQRFTINVLDCVNGAGVEIYSGSMASGIVGFFSCDEPGNGSPIVNATGDVILNIERCRNYAKILKGAQFFSGILGDRYGEKGAKNTHIKYCFSVNPAGGNYEHNNTPSQNSGKEYPIVSFVNGNSKKEHLNGGNTGTLYNYFLSDLTRNTWAVDADRLGNTQYEPLQRANGAWVYSVVKDSTRYFLYLHIGQDSISGIDFTKLKADDAIISGGQTIGKVLFTTPVTGTNDYSNMASVVEENVYGIRYGVDAADDARIFDDYVREFCYREANMLLPPEKAVLSKDGDNRFTLKVDAPAYAGGDVSYEAVLYGKVEGADAAVIPVASILSPDGAAQSENNTFTFTGDTCIFTLSDDVLGQGGEVYAEVRAVHADGAGGKSDPVESNRVSIGSVLPDPKLRVELVESNGGYMYRLRLDNADDYPAGSVTVTRMDGDSVVFDVNGNGEISSVGIPLQQLTVQVENGPAASSAVAVPVYLPTYTPLIPVKNGSQEPVWKVTGTSLADMSISVTIPGGSGSVTTPPVYRAELIGTWKDDQGTEHRETVFCSSDILTTANGTATAVFTNLPAYMAGDPGLDLTKPGNVTRDLKLRVWYAQPGLGPVYTYSDLDAENAAVTENNADSKILSGKPKNGTAGGYDYTWEYLYTPVLKTNAGRIFENYRWESNRSVFEFLPAPVLMSDGTSADDPLIPTVDAGGHLTYTFKWDEGSSGGSYTVSLAGIVRDQNGDVVRKVSLATNRSVDETQLTLDAENWSYNEVELTVTRKGDGGAATPTIGLTSVQAYAVQSRLPQPSQPRAANADVNELNYEIEWDPIEPETGCGSYEVFVKENNTSTSIGTMAVNEKTGGVYKMTADLEPYAGKDIQIYAVAEPAANEKLYVRSVDGITLNLSMPKRIDTPTSVSWSKSWEYGTDPAQIKTVGQFENGGADGLKVTVTATGGSIPPGGSSYLVKAYVFDTEAEAENAKTAITNQTEPAGALVTYPSGSGGAAVPVSMAAEGAGIYGHSLSGLSAKYAGKYMVFAARISSGDGMVSSKWISSDSWQLPYVRLAKPDVKVATKEYDVDVTLNSNPDIPGDTGAETWTANHTVLTWDSVDYADTYDFTLTEKGEATGVTFRIQEENGAVKVFWQKPDGTFEEISVSDGEFELSQYQKEITGTYTDAAGERPYETVLGARLLAEKSDSKFSYTLVLPDANELSPKDGGNSITDSELRFTAKAELWADVQNSDAYVRSDGYERNF